jgi:ribonuclease R
VAWKKCEFMADKVGTEHWGFVTGVASFGIFVELEAYFVEGLVHVSSLHDDFYHFSEETQSLIGERTRHTFRIGDRLRVRLDRVDVGRRQIDFTLVAAEKGAPVGSTRAAPAERGRKGEESRGTPADRAPGTRGAKREPEEKVSTRERRGGRRARKRPGRKPG